MNAKTTTPLEDEKTTGTLPPEEEDLSSGNSRLAIIVALLVAVVVLGYALLPAQTTRRIANAMPIMELGEASVTGHRIAEPAKAADPDEDATAAPAVANKETGRATPAAMTASKPDAAVAAPAPEPVAIEPVPAATPAAEAAPATVAISGRILDEDGYPLAGATVMLKGSRKATGTDANGNYTLEVPAGDNTLVYGYGGYEDQEVHTRSSQAQNVTLVPRENAPRRRRR